MPRGLSSTPDPERRAKLLKLACEGLPWAVIAQRLSYSDGSSLHRRCLDWFGTDDRDELRALLHAHRCLKWSLAKAKQASLEAV